VNHPAESIQKLNLVMSWSRLNILSL
jgi:hypothetical protein